MHYLHLSPLLNSGLGIVENCWVSRVTSHTILADVTVGTKVCTSEVDSMSAPFSLAEQ
jgi:hypothetical protein